ncbi:MAG TPA: hypothetical protein PLP17_06910 [Oligoflexia bacterium]|nr:hypothetical protein [Oligoflexia bacterium]
MIAVLYSYSSTDGLCWQTEFDFETDRDGFEALREHFRQRRDSEGLENLPDLQREGPDNEVYCRIAYNDQWRRFLAFCREQGVVWSTGVYVDPPSWCAEEERQANTERRDRLDTLMREHHFRYSINDSATPREWLDALAERRPPRDEQGQITFEPDFQDV